MIYEHRVDREIIMERSRSEISEENKQSQLKWSEGERRKTRQRGVQCADHIGVEREENLQRYNIRSE